MSNKKTETIINIQIKAVEIIEFSLTPCFDKNQVFKSFSFNINLTQSIAPEKQYVFVITTIDILDESKQMKLGNVKVSCAFHIPEISVFLDKSTNKYKLTDAITTTLNSISYSTTRGVMAQLFKGTFLHNAVLPVIDPKTFSLVNTKK